jgi:hypothetical protein
MGMKAFCEVFPVPAIDCAGAVLIACAALVNVERIYCLHRDEAFVDQFESEVYKTFVAMPFRDTCKYRADKIYDLLKEKVHPFATKRGSGKGLKRFESLRRISEHAGTAISITDSIVERILGDHFFVGDLTGNNPGVVVETGIAIAFKPNTRIILLTQGDFEDLHFDLKGVHCSQYKPKNLVETVVDALVDAAVRFEAEVKDYVTQASSSLTSDAILLLLQYSRLQKDRGSQASLFEDARSCGERFAGSDGRIRFHSGIRELLAKRLVWTDYRASVKQGKDYYGAHATKLGRRVISQIWPALASTLGGPTGPT